MTDFAEAWGAIFGALVSVAIIVLPVVVLYLMIIQRAVIGGVCGASKRGVERYDRTPRPILDHRYACGEIGRDEYEQVRRDLETG